MQYIKQLFWIVVISLVGQALELLIPLPIPAAVYGLVLMLLMLLTGLLKTEQVRDTAYFFISVMPILFVAPAVKVLEYWGLIAPNLAAILVILVFSTGAVFAISGLVTKALQKNKGGQEDA